MLTRILLIIVAFLLIFPISAYSCEEPYTIKDTQKLKENIISCKAFINKGSIKAKYNLAIHYIKGYGIEKNGKAGINLFTEAANQGHVDSLLTLSLLYLNNDEFMAPKKAIPFLKELVKKEHSYALFLLAKLFVEGKHTPQDVPYAKSLLSKSNLPESKELLAELNEPESDWLDTLKTVMFIVIGFIVISFVLTSPNKSKKKQVKKTARKTTKNNSSNVGASVTSTATAKPKAKKVNKIHSAPYHCAWCNETRVISSVLAQGSCKNSPTKKHEPIPTPTTAICRYCERKTDVFLNGHCPKSPHQNKHALKAN